MKKILTATFVFLFVTSYAFSQEKDSTNTNKEDALIGEWTIDLRPTPDAAEYYQMFEVTTIDGNTFKGKFYGSSIENGLINTHWEKIHFAFTTRDNSNEYYHSGYLLDGKLYGMTYCPNREFTAPWTGEIK